MNKDIISNIKDRRKELGINQKEFAEMLDMNQRTVSRYETLEYYDKLSSTKLKTLAIICEYLGLSIDTESAKKIKQKSKWIFGEPIDSVKSILLGGVWYKGAGNNCLEYYYDLLNQKYYFSFWLGDANPIDDGERITGEISEIKAITIT